MTTPIADLVKRYAESGFSRLHMPGHKGSGPLGCEHLDITEIDGADVLSAASGIIAESEQNASAIFKSGYTLYSAEGSTLAIKAMLTAVKRRSRSSTPRILAARNAHKSFIYACALLGLEPDWLYPSSSSHLCECKISPEELASALDSAEDLPDAVYVTSPDYMGNMMDIRGLSEVCHSHGIPLLVDNAHGAYLAFLDESLHPIHLGADMCCDSAHKTLSALTGGAYLHVSKSCDVDREELRGAMALFASTSPSYLILQSLDLCNAYLADGYSQRLNDCIARISRLKNRLFESGICSAHTDEPLKLVLTKEATGYSGIELAERLRANGVEPEMADREILVLMITPENTDSDLERVCEALSPLPRRKTSEYVAPPYPLPVKKICSPREAMLSRCERVSVSQAIGRICASPTVSCPPAIPIVVSGELIDEEAARLLSFYGAETVEVVIK